MAESPFILNCQVSKEEVPKPEIVSIKDANKFDSDDLYSPGQDTVDCLSNSNSLNPFNVSGGLKIQESTGVINPISSKEVIDGIILESDTKTDVAPVEGSAIKEETKVTLPPKPVDNDIDNEVQQESVEADVKSYDKDIQGLKRTVSIEIDGPTSDSVSRTSASGTEKPSKTSDSSSDDSSSSDSDSSSDSSSSDSSSSSSDQESESNVEPEKDKVIQEEKIDWEVEYDTLLKKCLNAMEQCSKRFQEHFKSLYHLAYFYFKSKKYKDLVKVKGILLENGGLFAERKSTNFFNGIWRIPNNEIDRPGNFASHMGRCTQLLLEFLKETRDYKMLVELALFLKLTPEADKKYLRDTERGDLCHEALSLAAISMRKRLAELSGEANLKPFLIDVFCIYKKVLKSNLKEHKFTSILIETFFKTTGYKSEHNIESDVQQYLKRDQLGSDRSAFISGNVSADVKPLGNPLSSNISSTSLLSPTTATAVSSVFINQSPPQTAPLDLQTKAVAVTDTKTLSSKPSSSSPVIKTLTSPVPKPFNAPTTKPLTAPTTKPITPVSSSLSGLMKMTSQVIKTTPSTTTTTIKNKASISPLVKSSSSPAMKASIGPVNKVSTPPMKVITSQSIKNTTPSLVKTTNPTLNKTSGSSGRSRGDGTKRPRGRPPGSVWQPLRHSINTILQQRPEMINPIDPFKTQPRNMLSITPVGSPKPRKPNTQPAKSQQPPIPASISITSVPSQPKPFPYQAVSITPKPKTTPSDPKLPPATIKPVPIPASLLSQGKSRPHPMPMPTSSASGPPPAKKPHFDYSVAQAIRSLGNTITITTSMGDIRPKSSMNSCQPSSSNIMSVTSSGLQSTSKPLPNTFLNQFPPLYVSNKSVKSKPKTSSKSLSSSQISSSSMSRSLSSSLISSTSTSKPHSSSSLSKAKSMAAKITPIPRSLSSSHLFPSSSSSSQMLPNPLPKPSPAAPGSNQQKDPNIKVILLDN